MSALTNLHWEGNLVFTKEGLYKRIIEGKFVAAWAQLNELNEKVGWYIFYAEVPKVHLMGESENIPVYVGSTYNLKQRLEQHGRKNMELRGIASNKRGDPFLHVKWCFADMPMATAVKNFHDTEMHLIRTIHPTLNISFNA